MPVATRTFRIFVSSTFEDLKEERNALQRDVFPRLRTLCEAHGARFQAIDLRWGVRNEAALDQRTMDICLREIERCQATGIKPNFIVLLGDRYGWQPLPYRILASEFDPRPIAGDWYRLDENADPPEYVLQARTGRFTDSIEWQKIEDDLRPALHQAARAAGVTGEALSKYSDSATHQEIRTGLGRSEEDRKHVFGFFRAESSETDDRLKPIKALIPNATEFPRDDSKALCDAVYEQLSTVIEEQVKRLQGSLAENPHDIFAGDRARIFKGRNKELAGIAQYLGNTERRPLFVYGPSGSGKSALLAKASLEYQGEARILRRFIGASPDASIGHSLLTGLCLELDPAAEIPVDFLQLERAFRERLAKAGHIVLFIDAFDQLSGDDPACALTWLPRELPQAVKVVVSTIPKLDFGKLIEVAPMASADAAEALDAILSDNGLLRRARKLRDWQRQKVLDAFATCGLPLYLKLAAEESRLWTSYASPADGQLGDGVAGVIATLFARLAGAEHGPVLVSRGLGYLAGARYGLTEDEVLDLLTADDAVWNDFDMHRHHKVEKRQLPAVIWSKLWFDLEPYLTERSAPGGMTIAFYHRQLADQAAQGQKDRHADLAGYFGRQPNWLDESHRAPNARKTVELPWQQRAAGDKTGAKLTLTSLEFVEAKCAGRLAFDLDLDYRQLIMGVKPDSPSETYDAWVTAIVDRAREWTMWRREAATRPLFSRLMRKVMSVAPPPGAESVQNPAPHEFAERETNPVPADDSQLSSFASFVGKELHSLETYGGVENFVIQHILNVSPGGSIRSAAEEMRERRHSPLLVRRWQSAPLDGPRVRRLEGHEGTVRYVRLPGRGLRAVSWGDDGAIRVWDVISSRCTLVLHSSRVLVAGATQIENVNPTKMRGAPRPRYSHGASPVSALAVNWDVDKAVLGYRDGTLAVLDLRAGTCLGTLGQYEQFVTGAALSADGGIAVTSAWWDYAVRVWNLETLQCTGVLEGHVADVKCVDITPEGRWAVSGADDKRVRIWDLVHQRCCQILTGHANSVRDVKVVPNGELVLSTDGAEIRAWDATTGECLRRIDHGANCVSVTPDGRYALSGWGPLQDDPSRRFMPGSFRQDLALRLWDLTSGNCIAELDGHGGGISCCEIRPGGQSALSGDTTGALIAWDLRSAWPTSRLNIRHNAEVTDLAITVSFRQGCVS